jgi:hypothetical protein
VEEFEDEAERARGNCALLLIQFHDTYVLWLGLGFKDRGTVALILRLVTGVSLAVIGSIKVSLISGISDLERDAACDDNMYVLIISLI